MLLKTEQESIQSGGLGEGGAFAVHNSVKVFEILYDKLYQNKTLAALREPVCNAADAHIMAGRGLEEISIHLPTYANPYFAVRDYGGSLTHDQMMKLYRTAFLSLKDTDNRQIGGFGIGKLSPFAICEQFTVTTWLNGERREYLAFKDSGMPNLNFIRVTPTTEPNGLEVRVAVKPGSISDWTTQANSFFRWWPVLPKGITGIVPITNELTLKSDKMVGHFPEWAFLPTDRPATVLMGLVPYTLDLDSVVGLPQDHREMLSSAAPLLVTFQMGDVSISPSRETLSYDPKTCAAIVARIKDVFALYEKKIIDEVASAPSLYEARQTLFKLTKANRYTARLVDRKTMKITWNGKPVILRTSIDLELTKPIAAGAGQPNVPGTSFAVTVYTKTNYRKSWTKDNNYWNDKFQNTVCGEDHGDVRRLFWAANITAKTYRVISHYLETNYPEVEVDHYGHKRKQKPSYQASIFTNGTLAELTKRATEAGLPPIIDVATLPDPPKVVSTSGSKAGAPKTQGYIQDGHGNWDRTETSIDLSAGGWYVEFFNGDSQGWFPNNQHPLYSLGFLNNQTIIGLSQSRLKSGKLRKELADNGWKILDAAFVQAISATIIGDLAYSRRYSEHHSKQTWLGNLCKFVLALTPAQLVQAKAANFQPKFPKNWSAYANTSELRHLLPAMTTAQQTAFNDSLAKCGAFVKELEAYRLAHPLLSAFDPNGVDKAHVLDYIAR